MKMDIEQNITNLLTILDKELYLNYSKTHLIKKK